MPGLTVAAFVIFLIFFIAVVVWTFRNGTKQLYEGVSELPLKDGVRNE
jgi:cbb3-type cytochrome oxidase subunit 3